MAEYPETLTKSLSYAPPPAGTEPSVLKSGLRFPFAT